MNVELSKVEFVALKMIMKDPRSGWIDSLARAAAAIGAVEQLSREASIPEEPTEPEFVPEVDEEAISWQERHGLYKD